MACTAHHNDSRTRQAGSASSSVAVSAQSAHSLGVDGLARNHNQVRLHL